MSDPKLEELLRAPIRLGANGQPLYDGLSSRRAHRLTSLYSVHVAADGQSLPLLAGGLPAAEVLRLGRLHKFYASSADQLPTVLRREDCPEPTFEWCRAASDAIEVTRCRRWLFQMPTGALVTGLSIDFTGDLTRAIPVLEDCYYADWKLEQASALDSLLDWKGCPPSHRGRLALGTHTHQILFVAGEDTSLLRLSENKDSTDIDRDRVQRLVYRRDLPARDDGAAIRYPVDSNRGMNSVVACGPYVSVIAGQQDYVENAVFICGVQLVASAATLGSVRNDAYTALGLLRNLSDPSRRTVRTRGFGAGPARAMIADAVNEIGLPAGNAATDKRPVTYPVKHRQMRAELSRLSETLSRLELELSFGVEAYCETSAIVPSQRVADFHRTLYYAAEIPEQADRAGQMLERLGKAISAERESVISTERHFDERRAITLSVAGGFLSLVAVAIGMAFAFFGVNTPDVSTKHSLLDVGHYWLFYLLMAISLLSTVLIAAVIWFSRRHPDG